MNKETDALYSQSFTITTNGYKAQTDSTNPVFTRSNVYYREKRSVWNRALDAFNGGRAYIAKTLKKHPSETEAEFSARCDIAYHLNLIKYATKSFGDYIFHKEPRRDFGGKGPNFSRDTISKDFDRQKHPVNATMRKAFDVKNLCGLAWILVDMPQFTGSEIDLKSKADKKVRPWARVLSPLAVPDWCFDVNGDLDWAIVEEYIVEKTDPTKDDTLICRRTLYTKSYYQRFEIVCTDAQKNFIGQNTSSTRVGPQVVNKLGRVPLRPYSDIIYDCEFNHPEIDDILTIHEAVLAGESELLINILKQTYGQLVLPMSSRDMVSRIASRISRNTNTLIDPTDSQMANVIRQELGIELSRTKALYEDEQEKGTARYIQPSGANTASIIAHNDRLMQMIIKLSGFLVGVDTTQRASAESKSIDNKAFAAQLCAIATGLQEIEEWIWGVMVQYDSTITMPTIAYTKDYNIQEFKSVIAGLVELANVNAGNEFKRQVKRAALDSLDRICKVDDSTYEKIKREIDADIEAKTPPMFQENATHVTDKSGSTPDNIVAETPYDKGDASIKKTEER